VTEAVKIIYAWPVTGDHHHHHHHRRRRVLSARDDATERVCDSYRTGGLPPIIIGTPEHCSGSLNFNYNMQK